MRNDNDFDRNDDLRARDAGDVTPRTAPLGDLDDFKVAEGYPDVRGWDVVGADGVKLGKVHELIVDTSAMRTRYLDVSLERKAIGIDEDRDVLVPIGTARIDDDNDHIILDSATVSRLATLPVYDHKQFTREYENTLLPALGADATGTGADYYAGRHFDDSRFYAGRGGPDSGIARRLGDTSPSRSAGAGLGDREIRVPVTDEDVIRERQRLDLDREQQVRRVDIEREVR
jgi:PRC-barrel domain protein